MSFSENATLGGRSESVSEYERESKTIIMVFVVGLKFRKLVYQLEFFTSFTKTNLSGNRHQKFIVTT